MENSAESKMSMSEKLRNWRNQRQPISEIQSKIKRASKLKSSIPTVIAKSEINSRSFSDTSKRNAANRKALSTVSDNIEKYSNSNYSELRENSYLQSQGTSFRLRTSDSPNRVLHTNTHSPENTYNIIEGYLAADFHTSIIGQDFQSPKSQISESEESSSDSSTIVKGKSVNRGNASFNEGDKENDSILSNMSNSPSERYYDYLQKQDEKLRECELTIIEKDKLLRDLQNERTILMNREQEAIQRTIMSMEEVQFHIIILVDSSLTFE